MLEDLKPVKAATKCKLAVWMDSLEPSDRKLMQTYLDDEDFATQTMSRRLMERGIQMGAHVIAFHRKKQCSCSRVG